MNNNFSSLNRNQITEQLKTTEFDLLIIGGGITGAGIALDAASRGMSVALVEKNDFASGTSSKSTKLIHGGLRYLKQFDFWLVKEVGAERAIVHKLAPHLVVPEKMLLPIIENGTYGKWLTSIGLKIYDVLAKVKGDDKRRMLNKAETLALEPLLPESILEGAGYYAEYRTDDARLTIEVLKTALNYRALALNYCKATKFIYHNNYVCGIEAQDKLTNNTFNINAKYVVNAAGPWVDDLRLQDEPKTSKHLHLTKGVHLVFNQEKLPIKQALYFDVPDGRMMFAIPRGNYTYIGTTDTNYQLNKESIEVTTTDALYLISAVNQMFPSINLGLEDVKSSWAGVRPLIHVEGKSAEELSRKDELFVSDSGLISIAGGKLTGYRKMAERTTDLVCKKYKHRLEKIFNPVQTENINLTGGIFKNYNAVLTYQNHVYFAIKAFGFSKVDASYLVNNYGKQTEVILTHFKSLNHQNPIVNLALAELDFCIKNEMVVKPLDFFIRRTGRLYFDIQNIEIIKIPVLDAFAQYFNWDKSVMKSELEFINTQVFKASHFDEL